MTYKVKLSKKNQGTIPVAVLEDMGLQPNQSNALIIYKNIDGNYFIGTQMQMYQKLAGSLGKKLSPKVKTKLAKMTEEEILEAEKQAVIDGFTAKHKRGL